jgi:hypothetical protein
MKDNLIRDKMILAGVNAVALSICIVTIISSSIYLSEKISGSTLLLPESKVEAKVDPSDESYNKLMASIDAINAELDARNAELKEDTKRLKREAHN